MPRVSSRISTLLYSEFKVRVALSNDDLHSLELQASGALSNTEISQLITATSVPAHTSSAPGIFLQSLGGARSSQKGSASFQDSRNGGDIARPLDARSVVERWNHFGGSINKMVVALMSFYVACMNDAAIGIYGGYFDDHPISALRARPANVQTDSLAVAAP
ncbi:hypothetical protein LLEC1_01860 [Akanthomyces lecanii]|uniref:Uncharacterized protein n=1 Tax=Cordyceps confragosa TaxID=2714763 RepID=A0A179I2E2_CORDF|nr:hypothetical protein LLEC1_01860 [Akanthomyces lecanii]